MDIQAVAAAVSAQNAQKVQSEISVKVFRLALDAQASSELALLSSTNLAAGLGQNVNVVA